MEIGANFAKLLVGGFIMGWGPCLAVVAPLLLPYVGATQSKWVAGLKIGAMFSAGRLMAVAILGALATIIFATLNRLFPPHISGYLYLIVAAFLLTVGVLIVLDKGFRVSVGKGNWLGASRGDTKSMLLVGFLIGISPCAPLVSVLTYIGCIVEGQVILGALYGAAFGLGTAVAPIVLCSLMGTVPEKIFRGDKGRRVFQIVCGVGLIIFGLDLIYYIWHLLC